MNIFLLIFLGVLVGSRFWYKSEVTKLSNEEKGDLVDVAAKFRIYSLIGNLALLGGYMYTITREGYERIWPFEYLAGAIIVWAFILTGFIYRALKGKGVNKRFLNFLVMYTLMQAVGIVALAISVSLFQIYP